MSSDIDYLKELFELEGCEDYDVIDNVLDIIDAEEKASKEEKLDLLLKGREVHKITLTSSCPATVVKAELNTRLDEDLYLAKYNRLDSSDFHSPGAWFVHKYFTVRSKKENGNWVQYAFKKKGPNNLVRSEIIEYFEFAKLPYDPMKVSDNGAVEVSIE